MNKVEAHIIAKSGDQVIGYVLVTTSHFKSKLPILANVFSMQKLIYLKNHMYW